MKKPKAAAPPPPVDPADVENRKGLARLRRLDMGGSATTILGQAMASRGAGMRATLTGMG